MQRSQRAFHVGHERKRLQFMHVHRGDIDSDESDGRILECGSGGRREITQPGA